jgi:hypothetical protein
MCDRQRRDAGQTYTVLVRPGAKPLKRLAIDALSPNESEGQDTADHMVCSP